MEYPEDMSSQQVTEAEAYAALFALGGYTYNNVVEEGSEEYCNLKMRVLIPVLR